VREARADTLQVDVVRTAGYPCIRLSGEGDSEGSRLLQGALQHLIESGCCRMILDTRDVRYLDLHCLETLKDGLCMAEDGGGLLVIVDQSLPVERTLKLLDVERLIPVFPSVSQAAAYLDWHR